MITRQSQRSYELVATPLHSKQQHGDAGRKEEEPDEVKFVVKIFDHLFCFGLDDSSFWSVAEDQGCSYKCAGREVDVKAPTPAIFFVSMLSVNERHSRGSNDLFVLHRCSG